MYAESVGHWRWITCVILFNLFYCNILSYFFPSYLYSFFTHEFRFFKKYFFQLLILISRETYLIILYAYSFNVMVKHKIKCSGINWVDAILRYVSSTKFCHFLSVGEVSVGANLDWSSVSTSIGSVVVQLFETSGFACLLEYMLRGFLYRFECL